MSVQPTILLSSFNLYACLPFVELAHETSIQLGPVIFWPASKYREFLPKDRHQTFENYFHSIQQVKAQVPNSQDKWINTVKLEPQGTTCISIMDKISLSQCEHVLIDAVYLLYFTCTFRNLYYGQEVPSFDVFRKMIPASWAFISNQANWEHVYIDESLREETVCIHLADAEITQALGQILLVIYTLSGEPGKTEAYKRLVRSIRYLVDRFFQRFVNLFENGLNFSTELFEPEDIIFLSSSFESLLDINDQQTTADFKHKLRPMINFRYGKPVELFWKWVDNFYEAKRKIIHGGASPDPYFRLNPNFEVSHILLGIKLYIYALYFTLYKYGLVSSVHEDAFTPPDFKWIHREEILLFFWTELNLLQRLSLFLKQTQENSENKDLVADFRLLSHLFVSMYERYHLMPAQPSLKFIPTSLAEIQKIGEDILSDLKSSEQQERLKPLLVAIHPDFITSLEKRLQADLVFENTL
jgi:hypothetical protein